MYVRPGARRVSNRISADTFNHGLNRKTAHPASGLRPSRRRESRDENGAVLLLALAYIIAISLIVGALADWAMNDLTNTTHFNTTSQLHIAVGSVTDLAIQNIRYTPDPSNPSTNPTGLGTCWVPVTGPNVSQYLVDNYTVAVWCNTATNFASEKTRTVTLYACLSTLNSGSSNSTITTAMNNCQTTPMLTAVIVINDYPAQGAPGQKVQCNLGIGQCGEGLTLQSWIWGA
jgi:hypothetical protein